MSSTHTAKIDNILTSYDMLEKYWKDCFYTYLESNRFEVQSTKIMQNGKERRYSYKELANIWQPLFEWLLVNKEINLGQMIRNYLNSKNTQTRKDDIAKALFQIALQDHYNGKQVIQEVIMFGMGMMFVDTLDWDVANSIIHITGKNVEKILNSKDTLASFEFKI